MLFFRVRIVCLGYLKRNQAKKSSLTHECGFFVSNIAEEKFVRRRRVHRLFDSRKTLNFSLKFWNKLGQGYDEWKYAKMNRGWRNPLSLSFFFLYSLNGGWDKLRNNPSFFYCSSRSMTRAIIFKCRVALIKWTRDARDNNKGKMIRDDKWRIKSVPIQFSIQFSMNFDFSRRSKLNLLARFVYRRFIYEDKYIYKTTSYGITLPFACIN